MRKIHLTGVYGWVTMVLSSVAVLPAGASEHGDATYLRVETAGTVFQIHADGIAAVSTSSPDGGTGTITTVNGSRIQGTLDRTALVRSGKSPVVSPIADVTRGPWEEPLYFIVLNSGAYLNGPVAGGTFSIIAPPGGSPIVLREMSHVSFQAASGGAAGVTIGPDGAFHGTLRLDVIALVLEASPAIRVYDRRVGANEDLVAKSGNAVEPMQIIHMNGSRMVGYCVNQSNGVRVRNVSSGLPADRGGMEVGDWVLSIDGEPVSKGYDIWKPRDAVNAGTQQHVLLETRRGTASRWYLIVK